MGPDERQRAKQRVAILTLIREAVERRLDVVEAVWNSSDDGEAIQRLREMVNIPDGVPPEVILDLQIRKMTKETREAIDAEISELRSLLQGATE